MQKKIMLILVLCFLLTLMGCNNYETMTEMEQIKTYNYTVSIKNDASEEDRQLLENDLMKIYKSLDERDLKMKEFEIVIAGFNKLELDKNRMFIDMDSNTYFNLLQVILVHNYSEYLHYGMMYGLIDDVLSKNFGYETQKYKESDYLDHWHILSLSALSFRTEIASEKEIELAKSAAVDFYDYILETKGQEAFNNLMEQSCELENIHLVDDLIDEWISTIDSNFEQDKLEIDIVFSQLDQDDKIKYITEHHDWILYFNKGELDWAQYPEMHESLEVFYDYLHMFYDEIERLKKVLDFRLEDLDRAEIIIYKNDSSELGGQYVKAKNQLMINSLYSFSHEYVHYVDVSLGKQPVHSSYEEMKAVFYSKEFELNQRFNQVEIQRIENISEEFGRSLDWYKNPRLEVENFTGRPLNDEDFNGLYTDLLVQITLLSGHDFPNLYERDLKKGYPKYHWNSIMSYITRNYGEDAIDSIMLKHHLPDGSHKDMTEVIEDWKLYITSFDEDDYASYYQ